MKSLNRVSPIILSPTADDILPEKDSIMETNFTGEADGEEEDE